MASAEKLAQLRQTLIGSFNMNELNNLCADLGIDYEELKGEEKSGKARELVAYCDRHERIAELEATILKRKANHASVTSLLPGPSIPLRNTAGSPFVVGRPLRAEEPIFGRESAFRSMADQLAKFSSVNLVGERRMGKTSLINHLIGHPDAYLTPQPDQPPLTLARVDLQAEVSNSARFYGVAMRELLARLPPSRSAEAQNLLAMRQRLQARPESDYDEFQTALKRLRDARGVSVRPVLVVDEFERLLDPTAHAGFPYPDFYNGLRALMTDGLLAMVVASRRPLAEYFSDSSRPNSLTSSFPTYFVPFTLALLDEAAADALLLQPSDHTLTIHEVTEAKRWANGHPCQLQAAGQAWYEAQAEGQPARWTHERFIELKNQNCMTSPNTALAKPARQGGVERLFRAIVWDAPLALGRVAQRLGAKLDDMAAWLIGMAIIIVLVLALLGLAKAGDVLDLVKKGLGLQP